MKPAILVILFVLFMNVVDNLNLKEFSINVKPLIETLFTEPEYEKHYFLDKKCQPISEMINSKSISEIIEIHAPGISEVWTEFKDRECLTNLLQGL